jgi:hypothetical protein
MSGYYWPPCGDCKHLQRSKKRRKGKRMFWECDAEEDVGPRRVGNFADHSTDYRCKSFEEGWSAWLNATAIIEALTS